MHTHMRSFYRLKFLGLCVRVFFCVLLLSLMKDDLFIIIIMEIVDKVQ